MAKIFVSFYPDNKSIALHGKTINGKYEGLFTLYDEDGFVREEREYHNGERSGLWITYFPKTIEIESEVHYDDNGELDGVSEFWSDAIPGETFIYRREEFSHGKLNGSEKKWNPITGVFESLIQYKDGKRNGLYLTYHDTGAQDTVGNYKNGKKDGVWKRFSKYGKELQEITYKNGVIISEDHFETAPITNGEDGML